MEENDVVYGLIYCVLPDGYSIKGPLRNASQNDSSSFGIRNSLSNSRQLIRYTFLSLTFKNKDTKRDAKKA